MHSSKVYPPCVELLRDCTRNQSIRLVFSLSLFKHPVEVSLCKPCATPPYAASCAGPIASPRMTLHRYALPGMLPALLSLAQVVGLDMVDDESRPERRPAKHMQTPAEWNLKHNPAYSYYAYYVYANLYTLNKLREARGMNTIAFRPHAGELCIQPCLLSITPHKLSFASFAGTFPCRRCICRSQRYASCCVHCILAQNIHGLVLLAQYCFCAGLSL